MTAEERAQILVTARLLEAVGKLDWLGTGLTLVAAAALLFAPSARIPLIVTIALELIAKLFVVRIAFDAKLLRDVASGSLDTSGLDHALGALGLAPPEKSGRDWNARCRGARRLVVFLVVATLAQCVAVVWAAV